ncbi:PLD nuclease N-terminal domain-containing protein [Streptomyces sp. NPDC048281]|uniref:PLD nuclease N-terminal domain-containing protein n=1 Tax=Streptomyces sp. NPDC048281 TaxID=3154715 RepID=UPI00343B385F
MSATSMLVYALYLTVVALYVYALIDCVNTPSARIRTLPKVGWLVIMILFPLVGAVVWRNLGKRPATAEDQVPAA